MSRKQVGTIVAGTIYVVSFWIVQYVFVSEKLYWGYIAFAAFTLAGLWLLNERLKEIECLIDGRNNGYTRD